MASYPNIPIGNTTEFVGDDGIEVDLADDGTFRGRVGFGSTLYRATVVHNILSGADRDTLITFYETNKALEFDITYDGDTYNMRFTSRPRQRHLAGNWWFVECEMIGNKV